MLECCSLWNVKWFFLVIGPGCTLTTEMTTHMRWWLVHQLHVTIPQCIPISKHHVLYNQNAYYLSHLKIFKTKREKNHLLKEPLAECPSNLVTFLSRSHFLRIYPFSFSAGNLPPSKTILLIYLVAWLLVSFLPAREQMFHESRDCLCSDLFPSTRAMPGTWLILHTSFLKKHEMTLPLWNWGLHL